MNKNNTLNKRIRKTLNFLNDCFLLSIPPPSLVVLLWAVNSRAVVLFISNTQSYCYSSLNLRVCTVSYTIIYSLILMISGNWYQTQSHLVLRIDNSSIPLVLSNVSPIVESEYAYLFVLTYNIDYTFISNLMQTQELQGKIKFSSSNPPFSDIFLFLSFFFFFFFFFSDSAWKHLVQISKIYI